MPRSASCRPGARVRVLALAAGLVAAAAAACSLLPSGGLPPGSRILVISLENRAGDPALGAMLEDALGSLLSRSARFSVTLGDRLAAFVDLPRDGDRVAIDSVRARELCGSGVCDAFLAGAVARDGEGIAIAVDVYRRDRVRPVASGRVPPTPRDRLLPALHRLVLEIREGLGEPAADVAATPPPGTDMLDAYSAYARASRWWAPAAERIRLHQEALRLDPDFEGVHTALAILYSNLGHGRAFRKHAEEAWRLSAGLGERERLRNEIRLLASRYEFDAEIERLEHDARLRPRDPFGPLNLTYRLLTIERDAGKAEAVAAQAYDEAPDASLALALAEALALSGRAEDVFLLADDVRSRGAARPNEDLVRCWSFLAAGDWTSLEETTRRLEGEGPPFRLLAVEMRLAARLARGRLSEASREAEEALRLGREEESLEAQHRAGLALAWLEARKSGRPRALPAERLVPALENLVFLPEFAALAADLGAGGPLEDVLRAHRPAESEAPGRYPREQIEFARGCALLSRGQAEAARRILAPLAEGSRLPLRHRVMARAHEALGRWRDAASEYEKVLESARPLGWHDGNPALVVLDGFRLARAYERLGDVAAARRRYERFLSDWNEADSGVPEIAEARRRLAALPSPPGG